MSDMVSTQDCAIYDEATGNSVSVGLRDGKGILYTDSTVTIEETLGFDNYADQWIVLTSCGSAGNTIRFQIEQGTSGDVTITRTASETDIYLLAAKIGVALNADPTFIVRWKAKIFNQVVFIVARVLGERGEAPDAGDVVVTKTGGITFNQDTDQDKIIRRPKTALISPDRYDNRVGILGVQGEVSSVLKSDNPIHYNVQKNLATTAETLFIDATVPDLQDWYISQLVGASELDSKIVMYKGIQRARVLNWTGTTSNDKQLMYECMPDPFQGTYWVAKIDNVVNTNWTIIDDPTDHTKSILRFTGNNALINGKALKITYDAVDRVLVAFIQKPGSAIVPLETPLKLTPAQFVIVTEKNRSANAGEASVSLVGFYEDLS